MNKQSKDGNISWTDYTWNPIRGLCPVNCILPDGTSYCYARAMYKRFKMNPKVRFNLDEYWQVKKLKKPSKIFVCSTFELFHPITKNLIFLLTDGSDITFRDMIFMAIEANPQHIFQILTKMPENIDRPMPDNVWLGVSVTGEDSMGDLIKMDDIMEIKAKIKFVSFEPMLDYIDTSSFFDWLIMGRLTGYGHKHDPPKYWVRELVTRAKRSNTPIFLKNNLKEIWGEKLIQEFPKGGKK